MRLLDGEYLAKKRPGGTLARPAKCGSGFDVQRLPRQGYLQNNRAVMTLLA